VLSICCHTWSPIVLSSGDQERWHVLSEKFGTLHAFAVLGLDRVVILIYQLFKNLS
jgi:hypothetical protein